MVHDRYRFVPPTEKEIEEQRRRDLEREAVEKCSKEQQREWAARPEEWVVKTLKLWLKDKGYEKDLQIWVDIGSEFRYRLVPVWRLEHYLRDNQNVYNYPVEQT